MKTKLASVRRHFLKLAVLKLLEHSKPLSFMWIILLIFTVLEIKSHLIENSIPFTIAPKSKIPRNKFIQGSEKTYTLKTVKTLIKETKDTRRYSTVMDFKNTVKMFILPNEIYIVNAISQNFNGILHRNKQF